MTNQYNYWYLIIINIIMKSIHLHRFFVNIHQVMLPSDTPLDNLNVCKLKTVTHVVTALTYGMDAYFAFRKDAKSSSQMEKIKGELKVSQFIHFYSCC